MVYNTENGASLQKLGLQVKSQISGKRCKILLLEIERKESKTLNTFQKLLDQISQSPQYNQSMQGQSREEIFTRKLPRTSQIYLEYGSYLNNHSEETILGSNKIKEQHETMKLQNEDVILLNT